MVLAEIGVPCVWAWGAEIVEVGWGLRKEGGRGGRREAFERAEQTVVDVQLASSTYHLCI